MPIHTKRIYDQPSDDDGTRVLVDRLWPRGVSKEAARLDEWARDIAPSDALRKEFHGHPDRWAEFCERYQAELEGRPDAADTLERLRALGRDGTLTLLYAAKDEERNNAVALIGILRRDVE